METSVLVTSAATGAGLDELRRTLAAAVAARRAASDRIAADIDALLERFDVYAGDPYPAGCHRRSPRRHRPPPAADGTQVAA